MRAARFLISFICLALSACDKPVPAGRIRVSNTSLDQQYNVVQVYGGGTTYTLKPGDSGLLPKGTSNITFSRRYKDYVRNYQVQCPAKLQNGITLKLIDVHLNNMEGGCKTLNADKDRSK